MAEDGCRGAAYQAEVVCCGCAKLRTNVLCPALLSLTLSGSGNVECRIIRFPTYPQRGQEGSGGGMPLRQMSLSYGRA